MRAPESERRRVRGQRHGRGARCSFATIAIAIVSLFAVTMCSGCLWIAIPSLAYQGYKAEKRADQKGEAKQKDSSQKPPSSDQYE